MKTPCRYYISFARGIVRGKPPIEALLLSDYDTDEMPQGDLEFMAAALINADSLPKAMELARRDIIEQHKHDRDSMLENLARVVDASLFDLIEFYEVELLDADGERYTKTEWRFRPDVDPRDLRNVVEIRETAQGMVFKLEPKAPARQQLIKIQGLEAPPKAPVDSQGNLAPAAMVVPDLEQYKAARAAMLADDDC